MEQTEAHTTRASPPVVKATESEANWATECDANSATESDAQSVPESDASSAPDAMPRLQDFTYKGERFPAVPPPVVETMSDLDRTIVYISTMLNAPSAGRAQSFLRDHQVRATRSVCLQS